jgi:hypothetical protein
MRGDACNVLNAIIGALHGGGKAQLDLYMFATGDLDRPQDAFNDMPAEAHDYLFRAMAHNAEMDPQPGQYTGPSVTDPEAHWKR